MAIRITGTIAGLEVDVTVEGIDQRSLSQLATSVIKSAGVASATEVANKSAEESKDSPSEVARGAALGSQQALQFALAHINQMGSVDSCDLINYLTDKGVADLAIKRALLLLRQGNDVETVPSDDGLQRVYRRR